jgi:hypothetical protein
VFEKKFPTNHDRNVIQFNKIQTTFIQINLYFWKKNIFNHLCDWKYLKNQLKFFPFWYILKKLCNIEIDVCAMFQIKYGLSRMHSTIFSDHMRWLVAKELISILGVQGSNFTNYIVVVNDGMLIVCTLHN